MWARPIAGAAILAAVVWRVGAEPFARGLLSMDVCIGRVRGRALIAVATAASAWRWRVIAQRLGAHISLPNAIASYYRSQFLNAVLPGGVLGDVHRAVTHGTDACSLAQAARAVAIERLTGQVALAAATAAVVIWTAPAFGPTVLVVMAIAVAVVALIIGAMTLARRGRGIIRRESGTSAQGRRFRRRARADRGEFGGGAGVPCHTVRRGRYRCRHAGCRFRS